MDLIEVKILNTTIENVLNRQMSELGLTSTQSSVLIFLNLSTKEYVCQKDIEQALSLTHPTISSVLKRLEEKGIITTEPLPEDNRFKCIKLTEKSRLLNKELFRKTDEVYQNAIKEFTEEEIKQFSEFLKRMNNNLK